MNELELIKQFYNEEWKTEDMPPFEELTEDQIEEIEGCIQFEYFVLDKELDVFFDETMDFIKKLKS